jgi:RimJ/RimL family protein N-acetyltransferase
VIEVRPVTLEGTLVRLEPLELAHVDELWPVAAEPELWRFTMNRVATRADLERYVRTALDEHERGTALPFITRLRATGAAIGSTRFANIAPEHRRVEIGWTWVGGAWQRSGANVDAKRQMLTHAFERWGVMRVELKTSHLNRRSRQAMLRLGAVEEGALRRHAINDDGSVRDTVYYSILDDEWPGVRDALDRRLARGEVHLSRRSP